MAISVLDFKRFRAIHAAALIATAVSVCSLGRPAEADGAASTRNIILGAAATSVGVILNTNLVHKQQQRDAELGYGRDGTPYYGGDGSYPSYAQDQGPSWRDEGRHNAWSRHERRDEYDRDDEDGYRRGREHRHRD